MASSPSFKRSPPFVNEQSPSPTPTKRRKAKQPVNIQTLHQTDIDVLERAASLLNKSVPELLEANAREGSQSVASLSFAGSPAPSSAGAPASPQPWSLSPYPVEQEEFNRDIPSSTLEFHGQGTSLDTSLMSAQFGMGNWPSTFQFDLSGLQTTPYVSSVGMNAQRPFGVAHTALPGSILGPLESSGTDELAATPTDQTSDVVSIVESPQWQDSQIASIAANAPYNDRRDAWISDTQALAASARPASVANSPSPSNQLVPASSATSGWDDAKFSGRKPFSDQTLRKETSDTRKLKACVRCRMQKIRCQIDEDDPTGKCKTCQSISGPRLYTLPCARYKISECTLYRTGKAPGLEFTFRWPEMKLKDITSWADKKVRTINILSDACGLPYTLHVRRFIPLPQDSMNRGWMDGKTKKFKETTPFAIVNMSSVVSEMREYIDQNALECMAFFLQDTDPLIKETYAFAIKHAERHGEDEEGILMGNFIRLWFAIRRTHTIEHIVGEDKLDMEPEVKDESFPLFGKVPLPPVMIQQLDMILTLGVLRPLRKKVLENLQKLILSNKPASWLTVYLTTFMSLHQCSVISLENYRNARRQGLKRRYSMPTFITERHHAANVFLSHYHYRTQPCNPFKLDWRRRHTTPFADMTPAEIQFIMRTKQLVDQRREAFAAAQSAHLYEDDCYFVSQMFQDDWQPRSSVIDFDAGTINNQPLRKYG